MRKVTIRGFLGLALIAGGVASGCVSNSDVIFDDAGTTPDSSKTDAPAGNDSGPKPDSSAIDSSTNDGSVDDGSAADADDGSADDSSVTDGGPICPVCAKLQACCSVPKSVNYGKCYSKFCLACCM